LGGSSKSAAREQAGTSAASGRSGDSRTRGRSGCEREEGELDAEEELERKALCASQSVREIAKSSGPERPRLRQRSWTSPPPSPLPPMRKLERSMEAESEGALEDALEEEEEEARGGGGEDGG